MTASCFYIKKLILHEKWDLCLGRVSLEEVKVAGGCGADLLNRPRVPILRLCSGTPSGQTPPRTLQSSWPYRRRCTKVWCSSPIKKTLEGGVGGSSLYLVVRIAWSEQSIDSCLEAAFLSVPHAMPVSWILNWVIVILSLIIDNKHSSQVHKMPTVLHLWALPVGYPFLHRPSGLLPSDPHRRHGGVQSAVQSSAAFTGPSAFFLPLLHASSGVFISGLNMFPQICLEFSWNTNSVTGGAAMVPLECTEGGEWVSWTQRSPLPGW